MMLDSSASDLDECDAELNHLAKRCTRAKDILPLPFHGSLA